MLEGIPRLLLQLEEKYHTTPIKEKVGDIISKSTTETRFLQDTLIVGQRLVRDYQVVTPHQWKTQHLRMDGIYLPMGQPLNKEL